MLISQISQMSISRPAFVNLLNEPRKSVEGDIHNPNKNTGTIDKGLLTKGKCCKMWISRTGHCTRVGENCLNEICGAEVTSAYSEYCNIHRSSNVNWKNLDENIHDERGCVRVNQTKIRSFVGISNDNPLGGSNYCNDHTKSNHLDLDPNDVNMSGCSNVDLNTKVPQGGQKRRFKPNIQYYER